MWVWVFQGFECFCISSYWWVCFLSLCQQLAWQQQVCWCLVSYGEISMNLSGCLLLLDHPLPYVLNENSPSIVSADPEHKSLEYTVLPLHVQSYTEKATQGCALVRRSLPRHTLKGRNCAACCGSHASSPLNTAANVHQVRKEAGEATRNVKPHEPCLPLPRSQGTHAYSMYNTSVIIWWTSPKAILLTLPRVSMPNPFILEW